MDIAATLLPEPLSPTRPRVFPFSTRKETSSTALISTPSEKKCVRRSRTSRMVPIELKRPGLPILTMHFAERIGNLAYAGVRVNRGNDMRQEILLTCEQQTPDAGETRDCLDDHGWFRTAKQVGRAVPFRTPDQRNESESSVLRWSETDLRRRRCAPASRWNAGKRMRNPESVSAPSRSRSRQASRRAAQSVSRHSKAWRSMSSVISSIAYAPPTGSTVLVTPDSQAMICCVRSASRAASAVGSASASSLELVCSDWAPPRTAASA